MWSQISDPRHLLRKVLDEVVTAGAPDEILYVGKPHIGTFRLVGVVEKMRAEIVRLGGEIRFGQRVVDVLIEDGRMRGVVVEGPLVLADARAANGQTDVATDADRTAKNTLHVIGDVLEFGPAARQHDLAPDWSGEAE